MNLSKTAGISVETVKSVLPKAKKACHLTGSLTSLNKDVVQLSDSAKRWSKPLREYIPTIPKEAEGLAIPSHHDVNGDNISIRAILDEIKHNSLTKRRNIELPYRIKTIYRYDRAFSKLTPLEKDCIVYRGRAKHPIIERFNQDFEIIKNAKSGDIIIPDTAYSYTGFKRELASNWSSSCGGETMMYTIRLPKGAKVSRNLEHGGEVLMPRGAEYKLISKTKQGNHTEVVLEYILPTKDNVAEIETLAKKFNIELTK